MTVTEHHLEVNGCLFDLDGTLMLSTEAVERFWHNLAQTHGIDANEVLKTSHGRRTVEVMKQWLPQFATDALVGELEGTIPVQFAETAKPVPGVHELLAALPASQWGIVTSGSEPLAGGWLKHFLKIQAPEVFITAEQVERGKPDPAGYMMAAKRLGLSKFLVFEDAPAGIQAGKASGATVIGMATTYDADTVRKAGADIIIKDLTQVRVNSFDPISNVLSLSFIDCL